MRTPRDPYSVLGIEADATYDDARAAYRRLAEIFHPDRFADAREDVQAEAERQMKDLNAAWRTLRARFGHEDERDRDLRRDRWAPPTGRSGTDSREWAAGDDFATRARQARTRQRAQERRSSTSARQAEDEQRAREEAAERERFVQEARERLLREQEEQQARANGR